MRSATQPWQHTLGVCMWVCLNLCLGVVAPKPTLHQEGCREQHSNTDAKAKATFAITARAYAAELPYLASWLEHHLKLDIDELCIVVTRVKDFKSVLALVGPFNSSGRLTLVQARSDAWNSQLGSPCLKHMWQSMLDIDEYLVVPNNFSGLREFILREPAANEVRLEWLIAPYAGDAWTIQPPHRTYTVSSRKQLQLYAFDGIGRQRALGQGKYFAKLPEVNDIGWPHFARCRVGKEKLHQCCHGPPGYILHFTRGLEDVILKMVTSSKAKEFKRSAGTGRIKALAVSELCLSQEAFTIAMPGAAATVQIVVDKEVQARLMIESGLRLEGGTCERVQDCKSLSSLKTWYASFREALFAHHGKVFCNLEKFCLHMTPRSKSNRLEKVDVPDLRDWRRGHKCI